MDNFTTLVTGLLEAEAALTGSTTRERRDVLAGVLTGSSLWTRESHRRIGDWDEYDRLVGAPPARWQRPTGRAARSSDVAWFKRRLIESAITELRFEARSVADWRWLTVRAMRLDRTRWPHTLRTSAYVRHRAGRDWTWQWPLRVGVVRGPGSAPLAQVIAAAGRFTDLYTVFETDGTDACEFLVTNPAVSTALNAPNASVVVVIGQPLSARGRGGIDLPDLGSAGTIIAEATPTWFEDMVVQLSHDLPLDVALNSASERSLLLGDPEFVARTSVRQWGRHVARALADSGNTVAAAILDQVLRGEFNSERTETTTTTAAGVAAAESGIDVALRGSPPRAAAAAPDPGPERHERPEPASEPTPDERRLQAIVRTRAGRQPSVTDRFVPGTEHDVRVAIAAALQPGAVGSATAFPSPLPGKEVPLVVSVIAGARRTARKLVLPPTADSKWTMPVRFTVPDVAEHFELLIEVAHQNRVVQSARLSGTPLVLTVDQSAPNAGLADRTPASATISIVELDGRHPVPVDFDRDAGDLDPDSIKEATEDLRRTLLEAFVTQPVDLAGAAAQLTRLAVCGSTLYERLCGLGTGYHDDDPWIHISAFTTRQIPLELIYTHPMPANDELVPVCHEALGGSTSCSATCASRRRDDVVCPFAFWATSKVIERRVHVPGRVTATPATQRMVKPLSSSVVGVSVKADEVDRTASKRIARALSSSVATSVVATSWSDLERVVTRHPSLVLLVTHTARAANGRALGTSLELNGDVRAVHRIKDSSINPGGLEPGPVVLALGCDTNKLSAGFTDLVSNVQRARAEIVVSTIAPIPGKGVADFLEVFLPILRDHLATAGVHRFGAAMLAARQASIAGGDLMALALTAIGDADVGLVS